MDVANVKTRFVCVVHVISENLELVFNGEQAKTYTSQDTAGSLITFSPHCCHILT